MDQEDKAEYRSFLASLDDSLFVSHISSLSHSQDPQKPVAANSSPVLSTQLDPFADSFNELLLAQQRHKHSVEENPDILDDLDASSDLNRLDNSSDSDNSDHIGPMHQFGEYGVYFKNKHNKQQQNDDRYRQWDLERRRIQGQEEFKEPIFKGCVIHVNGHTVPSINEIHKIVVIHGGKFLAFLGKKSAATHIICDRLTPRKETIFKRCRVVKAQWIVDCVEAKRLLDWNKYRLFKEISYDQQRLGFSLDFRVQQFNTEHMAEDEEENVLENEYEVEQAETKIDLNANQTDYSEKAGTLTAKVPDFLPNFFAHSRLHHLSTWKADLRVTFLKKVLSANIKRKPQKPKCVLHVDFDSFFVTASVQNYKELDIKKQPIAVSHGGNTSDVASCNYVARSFGVSNGMWIRSAKRVCPDLIVIDYDFNKYETYASELYNYLLSTKDDFDLIYPVLVDEALLDISSYAEHVDFSETDIASLCRQIRQDIYALTQCPVSIGVGRNVLLAKLALKQAKPDGYSILTENIEPILEKVLVKDLPGVGYHLITKLREELHINSDPLISDVKQFPQKTLMNLFGPKTGQKLYEYSRGIDNTSILLDSSQNPALLGRKSVSVDVNYGIRFDTSAEVETFMVNMAQEISKRLQAIDLVGSQITLKLGRRAPNAPINPPKYLGMGKCNFFNKSSKLGIPTNKWGVIAAELKSSTRILNIPPRELRGVGVTVSKLEDKDTYDKTRQQKLPTGPMTRLKAKKLDSAPDNTDHFKDPMEGVTEIDWDVFEALPWEIRKEVKDELIRRGMLPKGSSPKKGEKTYLQQLIPSGNGKDPKYVRISEPLQKSKAKSRTSSPQKQKLPTPAGAEEDLSYDSSVLSELPSSLKREILSELASKGKESGVQSLKRKFVEIAEKDQQVYEKVDTKWVALQPELHPPPLFLGLKLSFSDMKRMIQGWVSESMKQEGPHEKDVDAFIQYGKQLIAQSKMSRFILLIRCVSDELNYNRAANKDEPLFDSAIKEWKNVFDTKFKNIIAEYCKTYDKVIDMDIVL